MRFIRLLGCFLIMTGTLFAQTAAHPDPVMVGSFQIRMPGQAEFATYLDWSGPKKE